MRPNLQQLKKDVVSACRILSRQNLVQGFGHVSARIIDSDQLFITPRISLALVTEGELLTMNLDGEVVAGDHPAPFEAALHVSIMKMEPVHNHGSFFAGGVPVFYLPDLISTPRLGTDVATTIGEQPAVLLRGNGQVTVGRTIPEAVMMAIYLEEAAEILYGALQIGTPIPLTSEESAKRQVEALPPVDLERAWNYFKDQVGG